MCSRSVADEIRPDEPCAARDEKACPDTRPQLPPDTAAPASTPWRANRRSFRCASRRLRSRSAGRRCGGPTARCTRPMARKSRAVGVLLIEPADDVGRDADEGAQRRRRSDAVLAAVPGAAEHQRDLLEVVDEELLRLLVRVARARRRPNASAREQLLQLLRERRLRDAAARRRRAA